MMPFFLIRRAPVDAKKAILVVAASMLTAEGVRAILRETGLEPRCLELELPYSDRQENRMPRVQRIST
jgi:hypothetical protein